MREDGSTWHIFTSTKAKVHPTVGTGNGFFIGFRCSHSTPDKFIRICRENKILLSGECFMQGTSKCQTRTQRLVPVIVVGIEEVAHFLFSLMVCTWPHWRPTFRVNENRLQILPNMNSSSKDIGLLFPISKLWDLNLGIMVWKQFNRKNISGWDNLWRLELLLLLTTTSEQLLLVCAGVYFESKRVSE